MKKILRKIGVFMLGLSLVTSLQLAVLGLSHQLTANAGDTSIGEQCETVSGVKSPLCSLNEVGTGTELPSYTGAETHPDAVNTIEPGVATINSAIFFALDAFRLVVSSIAIITVIISAIRLVAESTEEQAGKAKKLMLYGVIGFLVIQTADPLVRQGFLGEEGDAFDPGRVEDSAEVTVQYIRGIIGFVQILLGSAAVMVLVMRGFTLITNPGDEDSTSKAKKHVLYAIVGLMVVGLSEIVVRGFVFPNAGETLPDTRVGAQIIASVTNYLASFVAILSFISLFYAGYRYVIAGGNEEVTEKVKKSAIGAIIALVLSASAFALVNTIVTLDNTDESVAATETEST